MTIVTRFAPSPTWFLHIWSLRTVLYNYLFAKANNWKFMLRVEDTDRTRFVEWSIENMLEVLASVWLIPDEWPNNPWDKGPYYQSERLEIYKKHLQTLIDNDKAYYCFCSSEKLNNLREEQKKLGLPTKYDGTCRFLSKEEIKTNLENKLPFTIRLKVPKNEIISFDDLIKWKIEVHTKDIDDQILLKTDWFPTYHLANVVDDYLMWVTHVIRWDEWTPSTPKHVIMYDSFWWKKPVFSHIPLLLWNDRKKLSKRVWDVSVESYLEKWYLPEAIINYISLLGWNPKTTEEIFSMQDLIEKFNLKDVHKAWAIFDVERLNWFNSKYLINYNIDDLYNKFLTYLNRHDNAFYDLISSFPEDYNKNILNELKSRIKKFSDFKELTKFFYGELKKIDTDMILNEKMKINDIKLVRDGLSIALDVLKLQDLDINSNESIKNSFIEKIKENWLKNWQVLWPVRVALSREQFSPWALELIYILWKEKSIERIEKTLIELN